MEAYEKPQTANRWFELAIYCHQTPLLAAVLVAHVAVSLRGLMTWPPFYEDESWTYVATFEFLRGNWFSMGTFGEGQSGFVYAITLPVPIMAISPWGPEESIRIISLGYGLIFLVGTFFAARRLAPSAAWLPPAILVATPVVFLALRYGRIDVAALAFAAWALAAAAHDRPFASGVLSAMAMSIHPFFVWLGAPCLALACHGERRAPFKYLAGGVAGLLPQCVWIALNYESVRTMWHRYSVTAATLPWGVLEAVWDERERWGNYVQTLSFRQTLFQAFVYLLLPAASLYIATRRGRLLAVGLLVAAPTVMLASMVAGKNPYYVNFLAMPLAIAAAYAVAHFPTTMRLACGAIMAIAVLTVFLSGWQNAGNTRGAPTAREAVQLLSREIPQGAVVVVPNLYAGLLSTRRDVRVFNYHSLSLRDSNTKCALPTCDDLNNRLRRLMNADSRRSPKRRDVEDVSSSPTRISMPTCRASTLVPPRPTCSA